MDEDEYASDSDQSDEDYCPDDRQTENLSEVDSDDDVDDAETNGKDSSKTKPSKKSNKTKNETKKQTDDKVENAESETVAEDAEDDKSRADALWADFLSGTDPLPTKKPEQKKAVAVEETTVRDNNIKPEPVKEPPKKLVTQIFDFAGEKVEITKEIEETTTSTTNEKADGKSSGPSNGAGRRPPTGGLKRAGGGIGSVLGHLTKKNKISVLDKSKHDWDSFKRNEGIDEQLQTHNRGRDGYLDRQDFLDRTDVRQFEIEKSIRLSKRNNR
ncbi:craniofacial development protein 1 [Bradysia coprophila]|uniref:craniofacial development protein 1 n=1 Tax=Bradysia coprophila TaxID=38358 RepID=UPI00187DCBE9|nr:craniofacial development protein 1 [Bradysia coprophila]